MGEQADALLERVFGSLIGSAELMTIYIGDRLGLYAALADGWLTSSELASRAGIAERYAREWLEQQAVAGFLEVDDIGAEAGDRRYMLSTEHALVLLDRDAPTYMTPYSGCSWLRPSNCPRCWTRTGAGAGSTGATSGPT